MQQTHDIHHQTRQPPIELPHEVEAVQEERNIRGPPISSLTMGDSLQETGSEAETYRALPHIKAPAGLFAQRWPTDCSD
jgi:hypothetical protein